jgi:hypothetical protein
VSKEVFFSLSVDNDAIDIVRLFIHGPIYDGGLPLRNGGVELKAPLDLFEESWLRNGTERDVGLLIEYNGHQFNNQVTMGPHERLTHRFWIVRLSIDVFRSLQ